jgi:peptidoglycan/xylan/chitin deacetylase (PgdA/CDA1 family)
LTDLSPFRFDRLATLYLARPYYKLFPVRESGVTVLMYHSVGDHDSASRSPYFQTNTSPSVFRSHMAYLAENGFQVVPLGEIDRPEAYSGNRAKRVAITFDDGYLDFRDNAYPVLREFGFHSTVFVSTGFVGGKFNDRQCLDWDDIARLASDNVAFGSHTHSHPKLHSMTRDGIEREVVESVSILSDRLGIPVNLFAYPYAFPQADKPFRNTLEAILSDAGIEFGVTTQIGYWKVGESKRFMPRIPVSSHDDLALFSAKLDHGYAWLTRLQSAKKHLLGTSGPASQSRPSGQDTPPA